MRPLFPEASVAARFAFETAPETWQELEAGLGRIAREVGAILRDRDAAGRVAEAFLEYPDGRV